MKLFIKKLKVGQSVVLAKASSEEAWLDKRRLEFERIVRETKMDTLNLKLPEFLIFPVEQYPEAAISSNAQRFEISFSREVITYPDNVIDGLLRMAMANLFADYYGKPTPNSNDAMNLLSTFAYLFNVPKVLFDEVAFS